MKNSISDINITLHRLKKSYKKFIKYEHVTRRNRVRKMLSLSTRITGHNTSATADEQRTVLIPVTEHTKTR